MSKKYRNRHLQVLTKVRLAMEEPLQGLRNIYQRAHDENGQLLNI